MSASRTSSSERDRPLRINMWRWSKGGWASHSPVRRGRPPGEIIGGSWSRTRYDGLLHSSHVPWVGFEEGSVFIGQHGSLIPAEFGSSVLKPHLEECWEESGAQGGRGKQRRGYTNNVLAEVPYNASPRKKQHRYRFLPRTPQRCHSPSLVGQVTDLTYHQRGLSPRDPEGVETHDQMTRQQNVGYNPCCFVIKEKKKTSWDFCQWHF